VFTADHGEGLGEHGEDTHGVFLYQSTLHVPLIVSAPGRWPAARRVAGLASTADIVPTVLDLVGLPSGTPMDGRSLGPLVSGQALRDRPVPLESEFGLDSYGWAPLVGLTDGRLKWSGAPEPELYDLQRDPQERVNVHDARGADAQAMARRHRDVVTADHRTAEAAAGDAERLERLRTLGYVAGSRAPAGHPTGPDPKRAIGSLQAINGARRAMAERRWDDAVRQLEGALRVSPRNVSALTLTGVAHLQAGRPREASAVLRRAAEVAPANADVPFNLGLAAIALGDGAAAEAAFRRARELHPRHHDATVNLADLLLQLDRPADARRVVDDAHRVGLASPLLDFVDGRLLLMSGDRVRARDVLTRAAASRRLPPPALAEARGLLAGLGSERGR
jgi:Flp pilus assembly protein TadD